MNAAPSPASSTSSQNSAGHLHILLLDPFFRLSSQPGSTRSDDLARRLVHAGHHVSVITTSAALHEGGTSIDKIALDIVRVAARARFGHPPPDAQYGAYARSLAWRLWRAKEVDAVLAADVPAAALPIVVLFCVLRAIPLLLDVRTGPPARAPRQALFMTRLAAWCARTSFRLTARFARHVIALSPDVEQALAAERIGTGKITLSTPGCDTLLMATPAGSNSPALTSYPQLAQGPLVVFAGSMTPDRRLETLIGVASALQVAAPHIAFAFCGDGPARGRLESRALELSVFNKSVWFLDPLARRDVAQLLTAATAVYVDGGTASAGFFDALAAAKPVIVGTAGAQRELIEGRGAGIGLPENDVPAAARELVDFLRDGDGLRRASQQAGALAAGRFSLDRVTSTIRDLIESSVAADPRHAVLRRRMLRTKRVIDVVVSLTALIILSPLLLVVAIAVQLKMGGPVLFSQSRPGLKGKPFNIYKLRTMTNAKDSSGALLSDGERLTEFGKFLRRTSLDELPQLLNVLKGDMSLIGPRPLLHEYMPYYTAEQHRRHDVLPGISGWAQVNGRNNITWEDKFAMDVWYVDHISLWLDIKIAFKTLWIILTGKGVSSDGHATYQRFDEIMARRQGAEDA